MRIAVVASQIGPLQLLHAVDHVSLFKLIAGLRTYCLQTWKISNRPASLLTVSSALLTSKELTLNGELFAVYKHGKRIL